MLYSEYSNQKRQDERQQKMTECLNVLDAVFFSTCYGRELSEEAEKHIRDHINTIGPVHVIVVENPDEFMERTSNLQWLDIVYAGKKASFTVNRICKIDFDIDAVCIVSGSTTNKMVCGQWKPLENRLIIYTPASKGGL